MIELQQFVQAARQSESPSLPLELKIDSIQASLGNIPAYQVSPSNFRGLGRKTAYFFKRLLRLHSLEQREAAALFITAMYQAHPNTTAVDQILRSEKICLRRPITASQTLRAYRKFVVLEESLYEYVDDGTNTNHKELKFMHGLVIKLKTFFR